MTSLTLSTYVVCVDILEKGVGKALIFSTRTSILRTIDFEWWESLQKGDFHRLPEDLLEDLQRECFLVPKGEEERDHVLRENEEYRAHSSLRFVLQPTASCPFGCHYCGQRHTTQSMSFQVQDHILERAAEALQKKTFPSLKITWFGAEPLSM